MKVTGPEDNHTCKDDQLCAGSKAVLDGAVHGLKSIWGANYNKENGCFLRIDTKNAFNEINIIGMLWTVRHLWLSGVCLVLTVIVIIQRLYCEKGMGRPILSILGRA